jgi:molecular chaperone DnaK
VPQIDVTFDIDANGILSVGATDKGTGKEQKIVIQPSSGLAKDEIDRMVDDARSHDADDQRRRVEVETRNQADSLVYSTEKTLRDNADKIPEDLKEEVEGKIATLKTAISENNTAEMQTSTTDLNDSLMRLGQAVYSQTVDAQGPTGDVQDPTEEFIPEDESSEESTEEDSSEDEPGGSTVEGEFREV